MLTQPILKYFQNMPPGETIDIWKAKRPVSLIWAGREYIRQGGQIEFNEDYTIIKKLPIWEN
jgi:hypothetical protein